jgi:hypothetical protein
MMIIVPTFPVFDVWPLLGLLVMLLGKPVAIALGIGIVVGLPLAILDGFYESPEQETARIFAAARAAERAEDAAAKAQAAGS